MRWHDPARGSGRPAPGVDNGGISVLTTGAFNRWTLPKITVYDR